MTDNIVEFKKEAQAQPKIFIYDIETSPMTAYTWGLWQEIRSMDMVKDDWSILTWAGKWYGEDEVYYAANPADDPLNDRETVLALHEFIDEADIVVAHNGNKFDIKKMNARFLLNGLEPPSPYRKIDTLLEARKSFKLSSNRLDALGKAMGLGEKIDTGGFDLWVRFMNGDQDAIDDMVDYNIQDVNLLENVYDALRPWMPNHPNVAVYNEEEVDQCPKCGGQELHWRGYAYTNAAKYHRFQCQGCGGWGRSKVNALSKAKKKSNMNNIAG